MRKVIVLQCHCCCVDTDQVTVGKYKEGFPQLSSFINSHDNNAIFRRFGRRSARTLLQMQIDLTAMEKELDELDERDASDPNLEPRLHGYENFAGWNDKQRTLGENFRKKLCEYCKDIRDNDQNPLLTSMIVELLVLESQVRALGQASPRDHLGVLTWMINEKPLGDGADSFIFYPEDFVSVARQSEQTTVLGRWIEAHVLNRWPTRLRVKTYLIPRHI